MADTPLSPIPNKINCQPALSAPLIVFFSSSAWFPQCTSVKLPNRKFQFRWYLTVQTHYHFATAERIQGEFCIVMRWRNPVDERKVSFSHLKIEKSQSPGPCTFILNSGQISFLPHLRSLDESFTASLLLELSSDDESEAVLHIRQNGYRCVHCHFLSNAYPSSYRIYSPIVNMII